MMDDMPTARTIATLARASTTSFEQAVSLIESYARTYASGEVCKAVQEQHDRTMAILDEVVR